MVYENKQDWPEKYDINKLVSRSGNIDKIIKGKKSSVRRNDRYADSDDELALNKHSFIVKDIYPQKLKTITKENAKQEGYNSLDEFKRALTSIHHGVVWDPERVVWAHELKEK